MSLDGEVHAKDLCVEGSDHSVGGGVGVVVKVVCVKRAG